MPVVSGAIAPIHGAILEILIGVNLFKREALQRVSLPIPNRIRIVVQIDTGTAHSAIDHSILTGLDLTPIDEKKVRTTATKQGQTPSDFDQFVVSIGIAGEGIEGLFDNIEVLGSYFASDENIQGLLGQDVLEHCLFVYNGPHKAFSLAF